MKVIGLTGGIGSGKSTVSGFLAELGAVIIDADKVGHEALKPDTEVWREVVAAFGRQILTLDGDINREKLGEIVFRNPESLSKLNQIMHPRMYDMVKAQLEGYRKQGVGVVVLEAPLLIEANWTSLDVSDFNTLKTILDANGPMAAVIEAKRAGLVKHIGVSSHTMDVAKELVKSDRFETIMFPLNFITSEAADELLLLTREHDVGFIAMKPLEGGMLDNVTIAFKYLFQFPDVVSIVGIEKVREIEEIVQIVAGPQTITTGEEKEMERLRQELGKRFCRRCDYCQPCPEEIPISLVLEFPSIVKRLPLEGILSGFIAEAMEKAANCTKCGECEERCPYNLPIQEMIEEHVRWYQIEKKRYQEQTTSK